jgi:hypothetical protein
VNTSNTNTNAKTTARVALTGATIAAVTLALVTAGIVVSMMPMQTAHASCVFSPKGDEACSGGGCTFSPNANSCSRSTGNNAAESGPSGSVSVSDGHTSFSHNFEGNGNGAVRLSLVISNNN